MDSNERKKDDKFYGENAAISVIDNRPEQVSKIFVRKGEEGRYKNILSKASKLRIAYNLVSTEELIKISQTDHNEGICLYARRKDFSNTSKVIQSVTSKSPLLILDGITNPHNIGALLRSASYFGLANVLIISKERLSLSGALARVSEGGSENLNIAYEKNYEIVIDNLVKNNIETVITDTEESSKKKEFKSLNDQKVAVVLGSERTGVSDSFRTISKSAIFIKGGNNMIRGNNIIQSLNVSVACGIILDRIINRKD